MQGSIRSRWARNPWAWSTVLLLATMLAATGARAQRVEGDRAVARGLYAAEVPVNSQSEAERNAGFSRALAEVLAKLSGDRGAAARPGVGREFRRAQD
jgi:hypothetical protein